ncbi:MAG: S-adenosylmethionine:tRNA ribosyltransferase-isomerase [Cyclobacteriaceae bacterium]
MINLHLDSIMRHIPISEYVYPLPPERIAIHPLTKRDQSKLLVYRGGIIEHKKFQNLPALLPPGSHLYFNNTKVIPARLRFQKNTGALIEIFLLKPADPALLHHHALEAKRCVRWICTIGNLKKWNTANPLELTRGGTTLNAQLMNRETGEVKLTWTPAEFTFAEVINVFGAVPLPPYIKRSEVPTDKERYQTVYSKLDGAVAAPTAGLHFTEQTFADLRKRNIPTDFLTLHVSAGTFQPVKKENAFEHEMHAEQLLITRDHITDLLAANQKVIAVGTTSMRILESMYWYGVRLIEGKAEELQIDQRDPYRDRSGLLPAKSDALGAILQMMDRKNLDAISGNTAIYILPGYKFQIVEGLITNFHQPGSTLMLLVAALVGPDWKKIYQAALDNDYRFLSYGDSSLLLP